MATRRSPLQPGRLLRRSAAIVTKSVPTGRIAGAAYAKDLFEHYDLRRFAFTPPTSMTAPTSRVSRAIDKHNFTAMNPSIFYDGVTWRCIVRCVNYRLGKPAPPVTITHNVMLELEELADSSWRIAASFPMFDRSPRSTPCFTIRGYEDCRLFAWRNRLWASATCCDLTARGHREIVLLELGPEDYAIRGVTPLRGAWSTEYQKNWIPLVSETGLRFVYSIENGLAVHVHDHDPVEVSCTKHGEPRVQRSARWGDVGGIRGSSQAIRLPDRPGWLFLVHDRRYRSQFVQTDDELRITHWTPAFYFRQVGIEFSAGCALDVERERLVVSFSVHDETTELAIVPVESVLQKMLPVR